jgi:hypothetical protein
MEDLSTFAPKKLSFVGKYIPAPWSIWLIQKPHSFEGSPTFKKNGFDG